MVTRFELDGIMVELEPSFYAGSVDGIESCVAIETGADMASAFYAGFMTASQAHSFIEALLAMDSDDGADAWLDHTEVF